MQRHLIFLASFCVILFLFTFNKWLVALALLFIFLPLVASFTSAKRINLDVTRTLSREKLEHNQWVEITIDIVNKGSSIPWLEIEDIVPQALDHFANDARLMSRISANEKLTFSYRMQCSRGLHQFNEVRIRTADWFGLHKKILHVKMLNQLEVSPEVDNAGQLFLNSKLQLGFTGNIHSGKSGSGTDFLSLREYQRGDHLRSIHWRASAKLDEGFLVRQFELLRSTKVIIDVDTRRDVLPMAKEFSLLEYSLNAANLLSNILIRDGHQVGLSIDQGEGDLSLLPNSGKRQLVKIKSQLAKTQPSSNFGPQALAQMPKQLLPSKATLFLISPIEKKDLRTLVNLRQRGFNVICVLPNYSKLVNSSQLNHQFCDIKTNLIVASCLAKGITVINWDITMPFASCLLQSSPLLRKQA